MRVTTNRADDAQTRPVAKPTCRPPRSIEMTRRSPDSASPSQPPRRYLRVHHGARAPARGELQTRGSLRERAHARHRAALATHARPGAGTHREARLPTPRSKPLGRATAHQLGTERSSCDLLVAGLRTVLAQSRERAVKTRAGVGLADAQGTCKLAVRELTVKLQQHELALAKRQRCKRIKHRCATLHILKRVTRSTIVYKILPQVVAAPAPSLTQLIQSGITSNREQPGARAAAPTIEAQTRPVEPLERERGEILSRRAIAQKRDQIPMHIGSALPEEGIKRGRVKDTLARCRSAPRQWLLRRGHGSAHHPNYDGERNPSQAIHACCTPPRRASAFLAERASEHRPRSRTANTAVRSSPSCGSYLRRAWPRSRTMRGARLLRHI